MLNKLNGKKQAEADRELDNAEATDQIEFENDEVEQTEIDQQILKADQETLECLVTSILANKRLAAKIVDAWMEERDFVMAPREWMERKLGSSTVLANKRLTTES